MTTDFMLGYYMNMNSNENAVVIVRQGRLKEGPKKITIGSAINETFNSDNELLQLKKSEYTVREFS